MYTYRNIKCSKMTESDIKNTSRLFSNNYGIWSCNSAFNPGCPIKFSTERVINSFVKKPDRYVAMVFDDKNLIGHAFYMRRTVKKSQKITWILQLVVDKNYRGQKIGTKLIHSIFGLSDSYACGLFTSNPMTIKALENATFRHVDERKIRSKIDVIRAAAYDIFEDTKWIDEYKDGIVDTNFPIDHSKIYDNIQKVYKEREFPLIKDLPEGCEWLAFTFKSQTPMIDNQEQLDILNDYSDDIIKKSYSYMNLKKQAWTKYSEQEVQLVNKTIRNNCRILDLGCGQGRHSVLLAEDGHDVIGVDFSKNNIEIAKSNSSKNLKFILGDARTYKDSLPFDVVLSLYDVIGSFPNENDNAKIVKNAYRNLKKDGIFILSVMNMQLTRNRCEKENNIINSIDENIGKLLRLKSSNTMQNTGDVFNGKMILIDDSTGICYRKEQFFSESSLPEEYIVRDRRYSRRGIVSLLHREGFSVEEVYCFNAKDINKRLSPDSKQAKEILVIAKKKNLFYKLFERMFDKNKFWK
mgnify:CR=1 FL=1